MCIFNISVFRHLPSLPLRHKPLPGKSSSSLCFLSTAGTEQVLSEFLTAVGSASGPAFLQTDLLLVVVDATIIIRQELTDV